MFLMPLMSNDLVCVFCVCFILIRGQGIIEPGPWHSLKVTSVDELFVTNQYRCNMFPVHHYHY